MTAAQFYLDFKNKLKSIYDDREVENISDWIFERVTNLKKWERRADPDKEMPSAAASQLKKYLEELLQHKPVQYVLNEAWFYKRKFYVDEHVLIPRPETEELVEWIINDFRLNKALNICEANAKVSPVDRDTGHGSVAPATSAAANSDPALPPTGMHNKPLTTQLQIIDIGTGSGCIPVSLKKELPEAGISAIDVSETALHIAQKNSETLNTEINLLRIDFLNENEWGSLQKYDIIVSNPPYIPAKEKEGLARNVTDFEPAIALFVPGDNSLLFYEKIAAFARSHLNEQGKIYVEVHENYAKNVKLVFEKSGFISTIKKDLYGKERMVKAELPSNF